MIGSEANAAEPPSISDAVRRSLVMLRTPSPTERVVCSIPLRRAWGLPGCRVARLPIRRAATWPPGNSTTLFVPQRFDRIELRRLRGGVDPEENPQKRAETERQDDRPERGVNRW